MSVEAKEEATEMTFQQVFEKENVELKEGLLKLFQNQGFPKDQIMQMKMREVEAVLVKVLQKQVNEVVDYLGKLTGEMEQFKKVRR